MKNKHKKQLKTTIPLLVGVYLIWYSLSKFTSDELTEIKNAFLSANYWWITLSIILGALSHFSRAYCWKYMLETMGYYPNFKNRSMAVFVSYLVNLGIPRAGEVSRAAIVNQYNKIPFEKAFGTIVAERIIDLIVYLIIIFFAFIAQYQLISHIFLRKIPSNPFLLMGITVLTGLALFFFIRATKKSKKSIFEKIRNFIAGMIEGLQSVYTMKQKWAFIAHITFIWVAYLLMFYFVTFAFPQTTNLPISAILVCFVMGTLSFATTNGGIGVYPLVIQKTLLLYGITETVGASFGWIMWTSQTLLVIVLGGLSFLFLPILNKVK